MCVVENVETFQPKLPAAYQSAPFVLLANIAPALQAQHWAIGLPLPAPLLFLQGISLCLERCALLVELRDRGLVLRNLGVEIRQSRIGSPATADTHAKRC